MHIVDSLDSVVQVPVASCRSSCSQLSSQCIIMGFPVDRTNSRKGEPKRDPGPSQVSLTPLDDVPPNNHGTQRSSDQLITMLKWKALSLTMGFCVLVLLVVTAVLLWHNTTLAERANPAPVLPEIPDFHGRQSYSLNFVERMIWGTESPAKSAPTLRHPVRYVVVSETSTDSCKTQSECSHIARLTHKYDTEVLNRTDIGCNFMIGGDGEVYVGRDWDTVGEGLHPYDSISIGITFIGRFVSVEPSSVQLEAVRKLIELGVEEGKIDPDYTLLGLRQITRNQNPGLALYNIVRKCHHWSREP